MKRITFILLALVSGTGFAQNSTEGTADVLASIVSPITITSTQNLVFGKIAVGAVGGAVRVSENGDITYSDPSMKIPSTDGVVTPAKFDINAPENTFYGISIPNSSLTGPGDPMVISFTHDLETTGNEGTGVETELIVGGLLKVNGNQTEGEYEGTVTVTVTYE